MLLNGQIRISNPIRTVRRHRMKAKFSGAERSKHRELCKRPRIVITSVRPLHRIMWDFVARNTRIDPDLMKMPVVLTNIPDRRIPLLLLLCLFFFPSVAWAQGGRRPRIIEPKIRTEPPPRPTKTATSTRGVMIVLFNYEVAGKVSIETLAGKPVVEETSTDEKGQAQFLLKRRQSYKVKGSAPGFIADE